jgi:hypothetical protein
MYGTVISQTTQTVIWQPINCPLCGGRNKPMELDRKAFEAWQGGTYIQHAFPMLPPGQREVMITGAHAECFDRMFPEEDDDE